MDSGPLMHTTVENLVVVDTPDGNRVVAVEWLDHDPLTCDGNHLAVAVDEFLSCASPGCQWQYDPDARCPVHGERGDA